MHREQLVRRVLACVGESGLAPAIRHVVTQPEFAGPSASQVRRWVEMYQAQGIEGLVEQKRGRVGRRAFSDLVPGHVMDAARAAALEHGTVGVDGMTNAARAYRDALMLHPDLPAAARRVLTGDKASKSYVPGSIRGGLRVSPLARCIVQGPSAVRLAAPFTPCTYEDVPPGRMITADDMTANVYCWCEHPGPLGYIVGRPQVLAWLDVGCLRWQVVRVIMRASGQYTRDDVWGGIGDVMEEFGIYPEWLFEGGNLWRSKLVIGEKTGLNDEERFGGLRSLGCKLHHSLRPQSKVIEERFSQLQYASDRVPGYAGREERHDKPEVIDDILTAVRSGKVHPRTELLHVSAYAHHLEQVMGALNEERNDGKILRGATPNERWNEVSPQLPPLPRNAAWMFRSQVSRVTVRRDGMVHVQLKSGKYLESYYYRQPDVLVPHSGQSVIVYWNDRNPAADAIILTAGARPKFLCAAEYVEPPPRFDATDEQMATEARAKKAAIVAARTEVARLTPHFQRSKQSAAARPTPSVGIVHHTHSDQAPLPTAASTRVDQRPDPLVHELAGHLRDAEARADAAAANARQVAEVDVDAVLERMAARVKDDALGLP